MLKINFIQPRGKPWLLIGSILGSLCVSVFLIGLMIAPSLGSLGTATIDNSLGQATPTPHIRSSVPQAPSELTSSTVTAIVTGISGDSVRYYETQTGRAFELNLTTRQTKIISPARLVGFIDAAWSPDKASAAETSVQNNSTLVRDHIFQTGAVVRIGTSPTSVALSPNGQQVVYFEPGAQSSAIRIVSPGKDDDRVLLATRVTNGLVSWPGNDHVALLSHQPDKNSDSLTLIGTAGTIEPILSDVDNLEVVWSRDGSKLLYSYFQAGQGIQLWYMDVTGHEPVPLAVATGAHKCAWTPDSTTVVCGVPTNTTLSRDTASEHSATVDDIVAINTLTSEQRRVYGAQLGTHIGIINPLVSSSGAYFIFTNLFDQKLYSSPLR